MLPANRVIYNTGILYLKLLIGMALGLFTTRLVLNALGQADFGIYSLVAGVVGMLAILNSAMSRASMRFMSHSLGTRNQETIRKTFNTTLVLHFAIGIIVVLLMEVGGMLMFKFLLNIPIEKIFVAKIVFHFMVFTTFFAIISVPYDAVINSHEDILALSLFDILSYILKFAIAVFITYTKSNLLILYGFLGFLVQILMRINKQWYSRLKYQDCKINFRIYFDRELSKTILSFSVWNMFGSIASMSITQVRGVLLNMFFGVTLNAADGISKTASTQVNTVSASMTRALNPQLVKSEGSGDRKKMLRFTELATKFSVYLFALFAIPVLLETSYLLHLWLKIVPAYSIIFCQLILIGLFLDKFTFEINSAINAAGKIRNFNIAESLLVSLNIPIAYLVFKMGYPPYSIFAVNILIGIIAVFLRLHLGNKIVGLDIRSFVKHGIMPVLIPICLTLFVSLIAKHFLNESIYRIIIITLSSIVILTITFWTMGLTLSERIKIIDIVYSTLKKISGFKKKHYTE